MNVNEANDLRELSADELDEVNGAIIAALGRVAALIWTGFTAMAATSGGGWGYELSRMAEHIRSRE